MAVFFGINSMSPSSRDRKMTISDSPSSMSLGMGICTRMGLTNTASSSW